MIEPVMYGFHIKVLWSDVASQAADQYDDPQLPLVAFPLSLRLSNCRAFALALMAMVEEATRHWRA